VALRDSVSFWRALAFAACALAGLALAAALALTVPLGTRGPAPRPIIAVLVDDSRQATWLALANPTGTRLELRALRPLAPPPGGRFVLWLIAEPTAPPRRLGVLPAAGLVLDQTPVLLRPGATLGISIEAEAAIGAAPRGALVQSGQLIATDALAVLPVSGNP
jgi:anti-sigma-K factor RskA